MLPVFPEFKKLSFADKETVEAHTKRFPMYSDFDFASLWAWNVKEDMGTLELNGNLVVRFIDYLTGEPFYTFIGDKLLNETVSSLIDFSEKMGCGPTLHLLPEVSVQGLDEKKFLVSESRDHFDYIFELERYLTYSGGKLKSRRNFFNSFTKRYPQYECIVLDLKDSAVRTRVTDLYRHWQDHKGFLSLSESFAYDRFLDIAEHIDHTAIGLLVDGNLVAFHVSALSQGNYANGLFEKADIQYPGVYQVLMHEVAKNLLKHGRTHLNYEQDLGLESLRRAKMAFDPVHFFKKYSVTRRMN